MVCRTTPLIALQFLCRKFSKAMWFTGKLDGVALLVTDPPVITLEPFFLSTNLHLSGESYKYETLTKISPITGVQNKHCHSPNIPIHFQL